MLVVVPTIEAHCDNDTLLSARFWLVVESRGEPEGGAPTIFGTTKTSAFSTNAQSRFALAVLDDVLGPQRLPDGFLLILFSSGSNAPGELKAPEGRLVSSKSPSRVQDRDKGIAGRNGREKYLPVKGSLAFLTYLPPPLILDFLRLPD